jgi:hypothetical protein
MTATRTTSQLGRYKRDKGADAERDVARWLRLWYPEACRAVRNTVPDPGDLDCTSPGLFWSIKNHAAEHINPWLAELDAKRGDRLGILVVKRKGHASPGEWWVWLPLWHLSELVDGRAADEAITDAPVRLELRTLMPLLVANNYARTPVIA